MSARSNDRTAVIEKSGDGVSAQKMYKELMAHRGRRSPIVTELVPFTEFYPAETYHQDYYRNHPDADYSQIYIEPKVRKLKQKLKAENVK